MFDNVGRTQGARHVQGHRHGRFLGSPTRFAAVLMLLLTSQLMTSTPVRADDDGSGSQNFVYVESNDPAGNAIFGFAETPQTAV